MLLLHLEEHELRDRSAEQRAHIVDFLARFEDELASTSELEWTEALGDDKLAEVVGPDGATRAGWLNTAGSPLSRLWVVRVAHHDRARVLAARIAEALNVWVEVRECLPTAQRP